MKNAACVLIIRDGLILAVSRKDDPNDFGLPGGKVDPNESFEQAAVRETMEETGCVLENLNKVFEDQDGDFKVVTFQADCLGEPYSKEEGKVKWVHPDLLLAGSFGKYNKKLFAKIGLFLNE